MTTDSHDNSHDREIEAHTDALLPDPGVEEHQWRPTDVDPKAERRAERQVATLFGLSALFSIGFVVAFFAIDAGPEGDTFIGLNAHNLGIGVCLGGALLCIGIGVIQWARKLMSDVELIEERHPASSAPEDRSATLAALKAGLEESGIGRRKVLRNGLLGSVGLLGLPAIVMLRDLGPLPGEVEDAEKGTGLRHTVFKRGVRVVRDVSGTPIRPGDLQVGDLVNAEPETIFGTYQGRALPEDEVLHGASHHAAKAKAATLLLRMDPSDYIPADGRDNWDVEGIVAYSKICTHVGCPISLNERTTHHLLCPCHQSTFDLADSGKVVFGPAGRHLPQLPIYVDEEGFLAAASDYPEPVGPSFWERDHYEVGNMGEEEINEEAGL